MADKFLDLYDNYFDDIYRYTYFKTCNKWDTDDLVSEIFKKAYEKFNTMTGNSKAWLFSIARNSIIDYYRKRKDAALPDDIEYLGYPNCFEEIFEKKDELNCLKKSLNILSKGELEIINLRYFSDLKYNQISAFLGKSEDSIKMKAHRIIKKLAKSVKRCMEG